MSDTTTSDALVVDMTASDSENQPRDVITSCEAPPRHRRRRDRTQFSTNDLLRLEDYFFVDRYPDIHARERLADELVVTEDRIQVCCYPARGGCTGLTSRQRKPATAACPRENLKELICAHAFDIVLNENRKILSTG